jgi:hypothetical protein
VAALDQLGELVDDRPSLDHIRVVALDRQPVAAQLQRDPQPLAECVEHAVADSCELGGDVVRDGENFLHSALSVGAREAPTAIRSRDGFGAKSAQTPALWLATLAVGRRPGAPWYREARVRRASRARAG